MDGPPNRLTVVVATSTHYCGEMHNIYVYMYMWKKIGQKSEQKMRTEGEN